MSSTLNSASKYNSLELAERETKGSNINNQIEILDNSMKDDSNSTNLSSKLNSSNLMENIENDIEKDPHKLDLLNNKLFNRDASIQKPNKIANCFVFLYFKENPLITIGPHCKFYLIRINRSLSIMLINEFFTCLCHNECYHLRENKPKL